MKEKFVFAIRDMDTGKLVNAKCGNNGKYYEMVAYAKARAEQLNTRYRREKYKVVTFRLVEL